LAAPYRLYTDAAEVAGPSWSVFGTFTHFVTL
jgi:hypothetical protein